jgi:hypothetical protein
MEKGAGMQAIEIPPAHREAVGGSATGLVEVHASSVDQANRRPAFDGELRSTVDDLSAFVSVQEQATHAAACREDVTATIEGEPGRLAELLREVVRIAADRLTTHAERAAGSEDAETLSALSERAAWASRELAGLDREPLTAVAA